MSSPLPERYQRYAAPDGQRPTYPAAVELYGESDPIVYVPNAYGEMVPMRKSQAPALMQPMQPRDLTPQPLIDPVAARMFGGGLGAGAAGAGVGWGFGQAAAGIAAFGGSSAVLVIALLLLASKVGRGGSYREGDTYIDVTNVNRWWGKSSTRL
jgi:hypothetical protein